VARRTLIVKSPLSIAPASASHRPAAAAVPAGTASPHRPAPLDETLLEGVRRRLGELVGDLREPEQATPLIVVALLTGLLIYSYWPGLLNAKASWSNPQYSHGWIVPLCTLALLFWWRKPVDHVTSTARMAGLGLLAGSFLVRLICAHFRIITIDMYTFVPAVAGIVLMAGGWSMFRWAWAPIATLFFMFPLPDEATRYLLGPLQTLATMVSTYALQTFGLDAYREGNKIVLGDSQVLGVVDACAGLRMLTIFVWLALMIVLVSGGEWWDNLIIAASAIPIALIVNSTRITITGVMYTIDPVMAEKIFHDWAGYFMMPMALGLLFFVQWLLSKLVVTEEFTPTAVVRSAVSGPAGLPQVGGQKRPETPAAAGPGRFPSILPANSAPPRTDSGSTMS
jgi:exosortase